MERLTEWTGEQWIGRQERLNGRIVGNRMCMERLAAYEDTELTPDEVETLKYLRNRYEDETYDYCGEYGTENCQLKNKGWIPVSEQLPKETVNPITRDAYVYPVTVDLGGVTDIRYYSFCRGHWYNQGPKEMDDLVIAWKERPEPYRPE